MPSSTSSFEPRRFAVPRGALWCLVFFALAELGFRLLPRSFFMTMSQHDYSSDPTGDYTAVDLAIDFLPPADVIVVGTSRAREAVQSPLLEEELRRGLARPPEVRNYGTAGGRIDVWLALLDRLLGEGKQPRVLVVALDGSDFRDAEPLDHRYQLIDLQGLPDDIRRNGWPGETDMTHVLGNSIPLRMLDARPTVRYRLVVRGRMRASEAWTSNAAFGGTSRWARSYEREVARAGRAPKMRTKKRRLRRAISGYVVRERGIERLRELVNLATSNGVGVVLAQIPESPPLRGEAGVREAQERLRGEMRALAAGDRTWVWTSDEAGRLFGKRDYREPSHMNVRGASRFVKQIAPVVLGALQRDLTQ